MFEKLVKIVHWHRYYFVFLITQYDGRVGVTAETFGFLRKIKKESDIDSVVKQKLESDENLKNVTVLNWKRIR